MRNEWWRAFLAASFLLPALPVAAKTRIEKMTISGPGLAAPFEITDKETLRLSNPWYGKFIEWSAPPVEAPHGTAVYEVTLHVRLQSSDVRPIYQFRYTPISSAQRGLVYLPGKGEPWHGQNVSIIIRGNHDGRWNLADPDWDSRIKAALGEGPSNTEIQQTRTGQDGSPRLLQSNASPPRAAVPVEPVAAILDAFRSHAVVALSEGSHGNEQGHAFRLALIRDPRFTATVNDIVVEFGNARYQDTMDRFVRGEDVSDAALRRVWQATTQAHPVWDAPIYEEFFRTVRNVNMSLPRTRQLRVLLGDPPVDWDAVHSPEDLQQQIASGLANRGSHPAELVRQAVLAKERRALVIYGGIHLTRRHPFFSTPAEAFRPLVQLLELTAATKIFSIWTYTYGGELKTLQADVTSWRTPSLALLRGTALGAADVGFYYPFKISFNDKALGPIEGLHMEDEFDALLYLGPTSTITYSQLLLGAINRLHFFERPDRPAVNIREENWVKKLYAEYLPPSVALIHGRGLGVERPA